MWGSGSHAIHLVLITVLWAVVMARFRKGTQGGQWCSLYCLWFERTGTEAPDLVKSSLAGIGDQRIW